MTDTWMGDDFFHQGAFRLSYGFEYAGSMELSTTSRCRSRSATWDTYDWYLGWARWPTWTRSTSTERCRPGMRSSHIRRTTPTGRARAVQRVLEAPAVPTLTVGGWWDQEDRYGPLATYAALERGDTAQSEFSGDGARGITVDGASRPGGCRWWIRARKRSICGTLRRRGSRTISRIRARLEQPEAMLYDAGREAVALASIPGRRSGRDSHAASTFTRGRQALLRSTQRPGRHRSTSTSPIPPTRCPTVSGRSSRPTTPAAHAGAPGRPRTSVSSHGRPDVVSWVSEPLTEDCSSPGDVTAQDRGLDHRPRRRLGGQADRRVPRQHAGGLAARAATS